MAMSRILPLLCLAAFAASCSIDVKNGLFGCQGDQDCPSGWVCRADQRCWDSPDPIGGAADANGTGPRDDATTTVRDDATITVRDDATTDPRDDATTTPDDATIGPDDDATTPPDDAGSAADALPADIGPDAGGCVATAGQSCARAGFCGSTVDCDGTCAGGAPAPACACGGAPTCGMNGTWQCPQPPNYGAPCSTADRCGGTIDCNGSCAGGTPNPNCPCAAATCQANGQWTACQTPPGFGMACDTADRCGAVVDCSGACVGGTPAPTCPCAPAMCQRNGSWSACTTPAGYGQACNTMVMCGATVACDGTCGGGTALPTCSQCGTPTCANGCANGTCGASSTCARNGTCSCTVNECSCGANGTTCTACVGGQVGSCAQDTFGCGDFTATNVCAFGCGMGGTCACAPDTGSPCNALECPCSCGDVIRPGVVQCDGSCQGIGANCVQICRNACGPGGPELPEEPL